MRKAIPYALVVVLALVGVFAGPFVWKMDLTRFPSRASWQLTDRLVDTLAIEPGDHVADLGAGDGYFTFRLADEVGDTGKLYAVEVDEELVDDLRQRVKAEGYRNVVVIEGDFDDPRLPDGRLDLVFLCNVYHHIEDRTAYFERLRQDLSLGGRVAIVDLLPAALIRLMAPSGHWTPVETMDAEMEEAGYQRAASHDFLPGQSFVVYKPKN